MFHEGTIEERFQTAARNCCERWKSFDFVRSVQSVDSNLAVGHDPDDDEVVPHPAELLGRAIDDLGAVAAVNERLQTEAEYDPIVDLAASNRLDLTIEFLALRPAWRTLFDEAVLRTAAQRLLKLVLLSSPDGEIPSKGDDLVYIVDWLVERIGRSEVDHDLPRTRVKYGLQDPSQRSEQSWCDSVADTAREFSETGLIVTSLSQCSHYMQCQQCTTAFPELDKHLRRFETTTSHQCHELLRLLRVCLERASQTLENGGRDEFAWRAIVCGAGLAYFDSINEFSRLLSEVANGRVSGPALHRTLELSQDEIHLISFVEMASLPFIEVQWFLYGNDELVYLPSDGDLWEIPGAVVVLHSPEVGEWKRLMTGSDLEFAKRAFGGRESTLYVDGDGLFLVLNSAAAFQGHKWAAALASLRGARDLKDTGLPSRSRIESAGSLPDNIADMLLDRMTELRDLVASNSAAQVPIIDTLESIRNKVHGPSRHTAEASIRRELGDAIYDRLTPLARNFAIAAEYQWLDLNGPNPSSIVLNLGAAFENQLQETIFKRFCEVLLARGIRTYPELPGGSRPRPGLPVMAGNVSMGSSITRLLENGKIWKLNLRKMEQLLEHPLPIFREFLDQQRIRVPDLMQVLPEIARTRNSAAHGGEPSLREDASRIRQRWLGMTADFPNIFAVLTPGGFTASETRVGR